ncbi:hypothetical protein [Rhizobium alvei]|uniref:Uncharacterized protein n=1 Tax=Rhizobium alvei TaxID=1132659 RepID=A0ABT8YU29_9HYPH|nr:hypothetical protein [Rhizobium alvei]MDO6967010.1 hypothetical protein [Rhizobium alvei]
MTTDNKPNASIIEAVAEAWASIDGRLRQFHDGKINGDMDGTYGGYLAEAKELLLRAAKRNVMISKLMEKRLLMNDEMRIKQLEWKYDNDPESFYAAKATTPIGTYIIWRHGSVYIGSDAIFYAEENAQFDLPALEAIAQTDFERRVNECFEGCEDQGGA